MNQADHSPESSEALEAQNAYNKVVEAYGRYFEHKFLPDESTLVIVLPKNSTLNIDLLEGIAEVTTALLDWQMAAGHQTPITTIGVPESGTLGVAALTQMPSLKHVMHEFSASFHIVTNNNKIINFFTALAGKRVKAHDNVEVLLNEVQLGDESSEYIRIAVGGNEA